MGFDGYIMDHRGEDAALLNPDVIAATDVGDRPVVVVLGEAGIGKSDVLSTLRAAARADDGPHGVLSTDLGLYANVDDLNREVFESDQWKGWIAGDERLTLVLDSLDEAMTGIKNVVGLFQRKLNAIPFDRLRVIISCRTSAWPETLTDHLTQRFGKKEAVAIYEVVPLSRSDVALAATTRGVNADRFLVEVAELGVQPLASNPASLWLLLSLFAQGGALPRSRVELYERGLSCLAESPRDRRERGNDAGYSPQQLLEVASRIAAMTLLTGKPIIHTGASSSSPANSVNIESMIGGSEGQGSCNVALSRAAIQAALGTGVFSGRGPELFGPAHKTYGEYLAARYLARCGLTPKQRDDILYLADESPRRLVPQLQEAAAWLAAFDGGLLDKILSEEPEVILLSDVSAADDATKRRVVEALLARVESGQLSYDQRRDLGDSFGRLAHTGIADQLRPVLLDATRSQATREVAVEIAESCRAVQLAEDIVSLVLDTSAPFQLRETAGYAACRLDAPAAKDRMKALLSLASRDDPRDQFRGLALRACWPRHLTAEALFRSLTPRQVRNFGGSYSGFLIQNDIASQLAVADLPKGLDWGRSVDASDTANEPFGAIAGAIAARAWRHTDQPGVLQALAQFMLGRYRCHTTPFHIAPEGERPSRFNNSGAASAALIAGDTSTRRRVLETIVGLIGSQDDAYLLVVHQTPLAIEEDFHWLLDRAGTATTLYEQDCVAASTASSA